MAAALGVAILDLVTNQAIVQMKFSITANDTNQIVLAPEGPVCGGDTSAIFDAFNVFYLKAQQDVLVDLTKHTHLVPDCVLLLHDILASLQANGNKLVIVCNDALIETVKFYQLHKCMEVAESLDKALAIVNDDEDAEAPDRNCYDLDRDKATQENYQFDTSDMSLSHTKSQAQRDTTKASLLTI